mmetsp:Transcript_33420/g.64605  ORF Transcript_33420/g.64605 Transcript_33420/m.64605 type:complete len:88 (+) Transcript_33420:59-322(+)
MKSPCISTEHHVCIYIEHKGANLRNAESFLLEFTSLFERILFCVYLLICSRNEFVLESFVSEVCTNEKHKMVYPWKSANSAKGEEGY